MEVLLAQQREGDAGKIALQLARKIDIHSQLAPAAPPEGRGDETAPAEETP